MKIRSLFLASLAALVMASCSNEVEGIDNGGDTGEKEAVMQFGIAFSNTAVRTTTAGTSEAGSEAEQNFTDATIVIEQGNTKDIVIVPFAQFAKSTENQSVLWLKEKIAVKEGDANVYVFLNASTALKTALQGATNTYAGLTASVSFNGSLAALAEAGQIAAANNFLMCNTSGDAESTTFTKNTTNNLKVNVSRVAAKLEEKTPADNSFDVTNELKNYADKNISVKLTNFSYAGLQQTTSILAGNTVTANLYKPYNGVNFAEADYDYLAINGGQTNYCMENLIGTTKATRTNAIYKGVISIEGVTAGTTIYVTSDGYAFTSITDMEAAGYNYEGLTTTTSILDCWNNWALKKYENGVCYYSAEIETAGANGGAKIVRNNIYRLSVESISKIGSVLPRDFEDPTLLNLTVEENPWTVNLNSFTL